jgi:hypothetical protein
MKAFLLQQTQQLRAGEGGIPPVMGDHRQQN